MLMQTASRTSSASSSASTGSSSRLSTASASILSSTDRERLLAFDRKMSVPTTNPAALSGLYSSATGQQQQTVLTTRVASAIPLPASRGVREYEYASAKGAFEESAPVSQRSRLLETNSNIGFAANVSVPRLHVAQLENPLPRAHDGQCEVEWRVGLSHSAATRCILRQYGHHSDEHCGHRGTCIHVCECDRIASARLVHRDVDSARPHT